MFTFGEIRPSASSSLDLKQGIASDICDMPVLCTTIFHCKIMYDVRDKKLSSRRFSSKYSFFPEQQEHKEQLLVSTM